MPHSGPCVPFPKEGCSGCVKCGKPIPPPEPGMPRDVQFERGCVRVAYKAAELSISDVAEGEELPPTWLDHVSESRALPGNVLLDGRDMVREAVEELADCRSYLVWRCQQLRDGYEAGESEACREYAMAMRGLQYVALAFTALTVPPQ